MQLTVQGKQIDVGAALRKHVSDKLEDINAKYFNRAIDANVTFSREGHGHGLYKALIFIRIGKNIQVMAESVEGDPYLAFDISAAKVAKQLRRYKARIREHNEAKEAAAESIRALDYTLAAEPEREEEAVAGEDPVVVAEMATDILTLSVSDAVMRLDLSGQPALLFRNASHSGLNMVYRRPDGNIGWIDPQAAEQVAEPRRAAK